MAAVHPRALPAPVDRPASSGLIFPAVLLRQPRDNVLALSRSNYGAELLKPPERTGSGDGDVAPLGSCPFVIAVLTAVDKPAERDWVTCVAESAVCEPTGVIDVIDTLGLPQPLVDGHVVVPVLPPVYPTVNVRQLVAMPPGRLF